MVYIHRIFTSIPSSPRSRLPPLIIKSLRAWLEIYFPALIARAISPSLDGTKDDP
jgi:hypothetical protein